MHLPQLPLPLRHGLRQAQLQSLCQMLVQSPDGTSSAAGAKEDTFDVWMKQESDTVQVTPKLRIGDNTGLQCCPPGSFAPMHAWPVGWHSSN